MKTSTWFGFVAACGMLLTAAATPVRADSYKVDSVHSFVIFGIQHMKAGYTFGRFNNPTGDVVLDDADPTKDSFNIEVKLADLDTANAQRDKDLKGPDWFDAKQFATISFKSTAVKAGADKDTLDVTGDITLHGVTKSVTVSMKRTGTAPGMRGEVRSGVLTEFTVKRGDFDMKAMPGGVGEEVRLIVAIEGTK